MLCNNNLARTRHMLCWHAPPSPGTYACSLTCLPLSPCCRSHTHTAGGRHVHQPGSDCRPVCGRPGGPGPSAGGHVLWASAGPGAGGQVVWQSTGAWSCVALQKSARPLGMGDVCGAQVARAEAPQAVLLQGLTIKALLTSQYPQGRGCATRALARYAPSP
eukprot:354313-Chlamydomonas_euryale.AAC.2